MTTAKEIYSPKFTQGHWLVECEYGVLSENEEGEDVFIGILAENGNTQANARLIVAAPEMYSLLNRLYWSGWCIDAVTNNKIKLLLERINGKENDT